MKHGAPAGGMQPHPPLHQKAGGNYGAGGGGGVGVGAGQGGAQPYRGSPLRAQQAPSYEPSVVSDKTVLPSIGKANQANQVRRVRMLQIVESINTD